MKTDIEILINHFGSYREVAKQIGITERHLLNLRKGMKPGKSLQFVIKSLIDNNKSKSFH